jgi:hypothetical protein
MAPSGLIIPRFRAFGGLTPPSNDFGDDNVCSDNQQDGFDHDLSRRGSATANLQPLCMVAKPPAAQMSFEQGSPVTRRGPVSSVCKESIARLVEQKT